MIPSFLAWKPAVNKLVTLKVSVNGNQQFPNMAWIKFRELSYIAKRENNSYRIKNEVVAALRRGA